MKNTPNDTTDYIGGIVTGDHKLLKRIYEQFHKAILQLVETNGGSSEDARDVFQEALLMIYQKAQKPDFKLTSSFFTFFYAVCRNIWFNKRKKRSFGEVTLSDEMTSMVGADSPVDLDQNEQYALYRKIFLRLGKDCQQVLLMFLGKVSMQEIMEKMGYGSLSYTKKRKFKCKEQLVKMIEADPVYEELKE